MNSIAKMNGLQAVVNSENGVDRRLGSVINVSSVTHLSPFRYPGGKTWLVPYVRQWLRSLRTKPRRLVEPFAGGATIGLTAVFEDLVDHVTLVELDDDVASVWRTILSHRAMGFADRVANFDLTRDNVCRILESTPVGDEERAFATLLRNRVMYGGIIAPGSAPVRYGENGRGISSRWYPQTLKKRILAIAAHRDRIEFVQGDGLEVLKRRADDRHSVYFIDPPYTVAGRRLYRCAEIDHQRLFQIISGLGGDFLVTYDNAEEVRFLAGAHGLDTGTIPMTTTKHAKMLELLIGRNLDWVGPRQALQLGFNTAFEALQAGWQSGG